VTLKELNDFAKVQGLYPVNIIGEAEPENENLFLGSLEEYFAAATFLGAKAVFIKNSILDESGFIHEIQIFNDDDDNEEESTKVDLALVNSLIAPFKKYTGSSYAFSLSVRFDGYSLNKYIEEEWYKCYTVERDKATEIVEQDEENALQRMEEVEVNKQKELIKLVKNLISDADFVKISTQGGMKSYALEKHPQLEEVDPKILLQEIRLVNDKVKARGLHKNKSLS